MSTDTPAEVYVIELTAKRGGQITIPSPIREALRLRASDKIRFSLRADRTVLVSRSDEGERDDALGRPYLFPLEQGAHANPLHILPVPKDLVERARELTAGLEVDLDEPLDPGDE